MAIKLEGVTVPIASTLSAEGADSIEQIISMDPILLAIRTGLPFKFVLQLGSQAVVRRHLGDAASCLVSINLAYAQQVGALMALVDTGNPLATNVFNDAAAKLQEGSKLPVPTVETLQFIFRNIVADSYTKFLMTKANA